MGDYSNYRVVLPFRGEFGIKLMRHVPVVHAMSGKKIVCCEPGEDALYPSAAQVIYCSRKKDAERRDQYSKDAEYVEDMKHKMAEMFPRASLVMTDVGMPKAYFKPKPRKFAICGTIDGTKDIDVLICPRRREYGKEKNWPHWQSLADELSDRGLKVAAAGAPDSSVEVHGVAKTWKCSPGMTLDTAIDAMNRSKVVVATCAGLAHLAMWCGAPLLLISYGKEGLVAPGPARLGDGTIAHERYWPIKTERYAEQNHLGASFQVLTDSWDHPKMVADAAESFK